MTVLHINRFDSRCGSCGKGADPYEESHDKQLGYDGPKEGCHEKFTAVASDYVGLNMKQRCQEMRPDLPWVGCEE